MIACLSPKIGIPIGIVLVVIGSLLVFRAYKRRSTVKAKGGAVYLEVSKYVTDILKKMHERDLAIKGKAVNQYIALFNLSDLSVLLTKLSAAIPEFKGIFDSEKRRIGNEKLSQDSIKRREQTDDIFEHIKPIADAEFPLEKAVAIGNLLDRLPNEQNTKYKGIKQRQMEDKRWNHLFQKLNKTEVASANIFADKDLKKMIEDYIDWSFAGSSILFLTDIFKRRVPVDIQPSAFLSSKASSPYVTIEHRMTRLLEQITNRINNLSGGKAKPSRLVTPVNDNKRIGIRSYRGKLRLKNAKISKVDIGIDAKGTDIDIEDSDIK